MNIIKLLNEFIIKIRLSQTFELFHKVNFRLDMSL